MSGKDRVQQHRAKLQAHKRRRLEVCVSIRVIDDVRQVARSINKPVWSAVQDALEGYVDGYHRLIAEHQRLDDERARLLAQSDSPAHRHQIDEYNRQLGLFNQRLATFQRPPAVVTG
jgi:hypothetical protein